MADYYLEFALVTGALTPRGQRGTTPDMPVTASPADDPPCAPCLATTAPILAHKLPALDDEEGDALPSGLAALDVVDAHVHLFAPGLFEAIWRWFDTYGWPIRYRLYADEVLAFLRARGVARMVGLHYAHKPGIARTMNRFMADLMAGHPALSATATVFPGEEGARAIIEEGLDLGLRGVKLHCHVQCMSPDDDRLDAVYGPCQERGVPVIIHAGREPKSPAYACDPHALCSADRTGNVLRRYPQLKLVVPHLGADEFAPYVRLLGEHENLWLDTTMMVAGYFPTPDQLDTVRANPGRILYGTDFPNLPYAWDREARRLADAGLDDEGLRQVFVENAAGLFFPPPA